MRNGYKKKDLGTLINHLLELQKKGGKTVEYKGTVYCPETGNDIILTTEEQI
jgi:hypothetical protein